MLSGRLFLSTTLFQFHLGREVEVAEFERCDNLMLRLPVGDPLEASWSQRDRSCLFGAKKGVGSKAKEPEL